jgi:hypothetical protein
VCTRLSYQRKNGAAKCFVFRLHFLQDTGVQIEEKEESKREKEKERGKKEAEK